MPKNKIYWICQIGGWGLLLLIELLVYSMQDQIDTNALAWFFSSWVLCILLTHGYRHILRKRNWTTLPIFRIAFRVALAGGIMGFVMAISHLEYDSFKNIFDTIILSYWVDDWLHWSETMFAWVLAYTVYHYVENLRKIEMEKMLLKTSINETEAKVLRAQLNPHFVFNALNSIRALVLEDPSKAQHSITQLSNILRNSLLADRRKTVELREELKTVQDYLELEKVRYEERLSSEFDIDAQTNFLQIPPMMLQTLVENGIKHGVQKATNGGFVKISSKLINDLVHIKITNTGILGDKEASGGFGLKNTDRRLDLLYGKDAHFDIFQESENVVCAEIVVPIQTEGIFKIRNNTTI